MHYIFPVAYCILNTDMDKCEHIEYGIEDAPLDSVMLYDAYSVKRLQDAIDVLNEDIAQLHSHIASITQPEPSVQATEPLPEYVSNVVVKFRDKHIEHHKYSDENKLDNATIIAQVKKMFPKDTVVNVMIVEKQ